MITEKEIMVGNLFIGYDDKVIKWNIELFSLLNDGIQIDEIIKEPIPITEEWFLMFGFKIKKESAIINIGHDQNYQLVLFNDNYELYKLLDGATLFIKKIKYVHQLQNTIFWIADKELEINE